MSSSNYCFLTCIQISQEAGQVVWYSHLFQNFPQFIVIHTVKGVGIVNKAEIDVFLELSCFFYDPAGVGNLISGSSAFSKTNLNIWKFMVHLLLKPTWENVEHYFARMWNECNCVVVWTFFGIFLISTLIFAAKSFQSCQILCNPIDGSPPGSPIPEILQARTLEWVAISFSNAWKWKWSPSVMSSSSQPHGLQPTRLLHPWDFPGKSTGVGVPSPSPALIFTTSLFQPDPSSSPIPSNLILITFDSVKLLFFEIHHPLISTSASLFFPPHLSFSSSHACMLSHFSCAWLFATLQTIAHLVPMSVRLSRQKYRSGFLYPLPGDPLDPGIKPISLSSPALAGSFFTTSATWEAWPSSLFFQNT